MKIKNNQSLITQDKSIASNYPTTTSLKLTQTAKQTLKVIINNKKILNLVLAGLVSIPSQSIDHSRASDRLREK